MYIYIYISESQYGLGRLSRQNWIMESLCPLGDVQVCASETSFRTNSFEVGHTRQKLQLAHIATLPQTAGVWFKGTVQKKKHGRRQNGIQHHKIINLPQDSAT